MRGCYHVGCLNLHLQRGDRAVALFGQLLHFQGLRGLLGHKNEDAILVAHVCCHTLCSQPSESPADESREHERELFVGGCHVTHDDVSDQSTQANDGTVHHFIARGNMGSLG